MGWSLSKDCSFEFQGVQTLVSPDGNNVAWACPCGDHSDCQKMRPNKIGRANSSLYDSVGESLVLQPRWLRRTRTASGGCRSPLSLGCMGKIMNRSVIVVALTILTCFAQGVFGGILNFQAEVERASKALSCLRQSDPPSIAFSGS